MNSFISDYIAIVADSTNNNWQDNYDSYRFGPEGPKAVTTQEPFLLSVPRKLLKMAGLITAGSAHQERNQFCEELKAALQCYTPYLENVEWLYANLSDQESRQILCSVLAYRAMGYKKIKLPLSTTDYWDQIREIQDSVKDAELIDPGFLDLKLCKMRLDAYGYPLEIFYTPKGVVTNFVLQQYRCLTPNGVIEAEYGDTVLDCGGCWGDTALYFAHKAGDKGNVYSFEFVPTNLDIWKRNIRLNPELKERIHLVEAPVWSESGEPLFIEGAGPGSRVVSESSLSDSIEVKTISIDDLVKEQNLDNVSFIKMDIEGSELAALQGAENTLRRHRPKLAVCVYHDLEDFWKIPQFIDGLGLGYRFYLRHFTIHAEETVLFAEV
jgi:FkbM family methyltransferase